MPRASRLAVRFALGFVALLGIAWLLAVLLLDPTAHKERIEQSASRRLGMEVHIDGPLALRWRPGAVLVLRDVRARKHGADIVVAREAVLGLELVSLFRRDVRVHSVALHDGVLAVERLRDGRFNFQKDPEPGPRPERSGPDISFSEATITYADPRLPHRIEGRRCRGDIRRLHLDAGDRRLLARLSFQGQADCAEVHAGAISLSAVSTVAVARQGVIELAPLNARWFDAHASGRVRADFSGPVPAYRLQQSLQQVSTQQLLKALSLRELASGRVNLGATLEMRGRSAQELQQSASGTLSLRGQGLAYHGIDLDEQFDRFESTQNFNLFDMGAVLLAGPAGLLVTKGVDFASAAQGAQGKTEIRSLVSDWVIGRGVARTQDVALATPGHRVALRGGIDLVNERFQDMTVALVDPKGCAKVQQQVRGTLQKPVVDKPSPIETIAGPAVRLLKKGAELIGADSCEVFYAGAVPAPSPK
jgi:AsmA protein